MRDCYRLELEWVAVFLGVLKEQGVLQTLQLTVETCMWRRSTAGFGASAVATIVEEFEYEDVTADEMLELVK